MANDCWNRVVLKGDESKLKNILKKIESQENGIFNYENYNTLFDSDVSDIQGDEWGSKRFTPYATIEDGELIITGDSAWTPMIGLFEAICVEWEVNGELTYEESGYDFAGRICWDTNGVITEHTEWTYWEKMFLFDKENFYEEAGFRMEVSDSFDEFMEGLSILRWIEKPELDMDKLNEMWNNCHGEL